ncbi:MAG: FMN-binding negative transcriptional regulator [Sphingomonas sp.]|uniref:FMN-binding negative transcriptional regulator n=1 Tax=Sphingomonas sp. TaxID=28214 RepID=UPI003569E8BF
MHPNRAFRFDSDAAILDWAVGRGFAHIFATTPEGPMVVHAPIVAAGSDTLRFHVSRNNRMTPHIDGARLLLSIAGPDGYISPSWYVDGAQSVPTWNYVSAEIEGVAREMDTDSLISQLDKLASAHEPRVAPERPWTRDKMDDARFRAMLKAIIGFELTIDAIHGTIKLGQNKNDADTAGVIAGLRASGNPDLAAVTEATR